MHSEKVQTIATKRKNLFLRVQEGHFATSHSHINYFIDVTMQKTRLSEAKAVAQELVSYYHLDGQSIAEKAKAAIALKK